jgi:hypothetical protein
MWGMVVVMAVAFMMEKSGAGWGSLISLLYVLVEYLTYSVAFIWSLLTQHQ